MPLFGQESGTYSQKWGQGGRKGRGNRPGRPTSEAIIFSINGKKALLMNYIGC
jgi:hypothetical protein